MLGLSGSQHGAAVVKVFGTPDSDQGSSAALMPLCCTILGNNPANF